MYVLRVLKIAIILLVFIESMKVRLLAGARLGTKLFYMAVVMEASLPPCPVWRAVSTRVPSAAPEGCHKGTLLIFCLCGQVDPVIVFFRTAAISEVYIALVELRTFLLLHLSFFNVGFLVEM